MVLGALLDSFSPSKFKEFRGIVNVINQDSSVLGSCTRIRELIQMLYPLWLQASKAQSAYMLLLTCAKVEYTGSGTIELGECWCQYGARNKE